MTKKYLFDTNYLIEAFQKQNKDAQKLVQEASLEAEISISAISMTEIRAGLSTKQADYAMPKIKKIFQIIDVDLRISETAGELLSKYLDNGLSLGDSIIAVTAILGGYQLITKDRNFKTIKELQIYKI